MKSTFSRVFALFAVVILLCLLLLGVVFRSMLYRSLLEEKQQVLHSNALVLSNLTHGYEAAGELGNRWGNFRIALTASAQMADCDALLYLPDGAFWMCSCDDSGCAHRGKNLEQALIEPTLSDGSYFTQCSLSETYDEDQLVQTMALKSHNTGEIFALLVVTAPPDQIDEVLVHSTNILFHVAMLVLLVAMIASFLLSRSQTLSLQSVARAATRFGHGDLDARVIPDRFDTEEMRELGEAFNSMADSLAQSERQRQEFVANVSHELKTPMTTISGFMDGMLDGTIPPQQHRQYMQLISDEVRRLSRLVRSMLEISRLQSQGIGEDKKRRFDLGDVIAQTLISFEQRINRKGLLMEVQLPERSLFTRADPDSITQVIYNLIDNAIKFCNEGGILGIRLEAEGTKARITIRNTGNTVPPEELPLLFDRFHKADKSRSADRDGVGLGLYIVKTILNSHGEDIRVTSENGLTTFTFTLPLVR